MAKAELLFVGSQHGLTILSNPGGIGRWLKAGTALNDHAIQAVWAHPQDPTQVLCSSQQQLWRSQDGGLQWQPITAPAMTTLVATRSQPQRIVACDGTHVYISHDAGEHWLENRAATTVSGGGDTYWAQTPDGLQKSADGGNTWQMEPRIQHVVTSSDGSAVFAIDTSNQWQHIASPETALLPLHVTACLPGTPATLIAQYQNQLYRYQEAWHIVDAVPRFTCLHATIYHPDRVWAGTATGEIWYSLNRGQTWEHVRNVSGAVHALASARLL